ELSRRGWEESDSATRRRSDPGKVAIAARLRKETTVPIKWIAARVQIGTAKGAKSVLHHLAHRQHPGNAAAGFKPCTQLEFQSAVCLLSRQRRSIKRLPPIRKYHPRHCGKT